MYTFLVLQNPIIVCLLSNFYYQLMSSRIWKQGRKNYSNHLVSSCWTCGGKNFQAINLNLIKTQFWCFVGVLQMVEYWQACVSLLYKTKGALFTGDHLMGNGKGLMMDHIHNWYSGMSCCFCSRTLFDCVNCENAFFFPGWWQVEKCSLLGVFQPTWGVGAKRVFYLITLSVAVPLQIESIRALLPYDFTWVLPGMFVFLCSHNLANVKGNCDEFFLDMEIITGFCLCFFRWKCSEQSILQY